MKLLFDQNLSPRLVTGLADVFPGSVHVLTLGLDCVPNEVVWEYARANHFSIVSKDEDYSSLSVLRGSPPKVVWLLVGNCSTRQVESLLRSRAADLAAFDADPSVDTLGIG